MPKTEVRAFRGGDRKIPVVDWLEQLSKTEPKAYRKCLAFILELSENGNQMRRPHAAPLRDGIWELRPSLKNIHYRILYFFFGANAVALSHGITKEDVVPDIEIEIAIRRMNLALSSPDSYTADFDIDT